MVRRFEVLLPLRFNDGTPVPGAAVADTLTAGGGGRTGRATATT
jgi:hypothetical protein